MDAKVPMNRRDLLRTAATLPFLRPLVALEGTVTPATAAATRSTATIVVELPDDRAKAGSARLVNERGDTLAGPFPALGLSDRLNAEKKENLTRDPLLPFGNTPTGTYRALRSLSTGEGTRYSDHSYGPNGAIVLDPSDGDALKAKQNHRVGLLIHGGDAGQGGRLRATHGCVRLFNDDMKSLLDGLDEASLDYTNFTCRVIDVRVVVKVPVDSQSDDPPLDPPDGIEQIIREAPAPWIRRPNYSSLQLRVIPHENLRRMETAGREEARRRILLEDWRQAFPGTLTKTIALADYWWEVYRANVAAIENERDRTLLQNLTRQMESIQTRANEIYSKYQQTLQEMVDAQRMLGTLDAISSIVGLVQSGASLGKMVTEDNTPPKVSDAPQTSTKPQIRWSTERTIQIGNEVNRFKLEVNGDIDRVNEFQSQINQQYRRFNIQTAPKVVPIGPLR